MAFFSSSFFCCKELSLVKFYLQEAIENSSLKCLKALGKVECETLAVDFVAPAIEQIKNDVSNVGNWRGERDSVFLKVHGWFFMSWMTTRFGITGEMFLPISTELYLQILRVCHFEKHLIQVLFSYLLVNAVSLYNVTLICSAPPFS